MSSESYDARRIVNWDQWEDADGIRVRVHRGFSPTHVFELLDPTLCPQWVPCHYIGRLPCTKVQTRPEPRKLNGVQWRGDPLKPAQNPECPLWDAAAWGRTVDKINARRMGFKP